MAVTDLFPTGDVTTAWADGTGSTFDEVNEGVDSPNDADYIQQTEGGGEVSRFSFANKPSDFDGTNSVTIKIRHRADSFVDDSDYFEVRVFDVSGQVGATKNATHSETMLDQSFTDANWDAMTGTQIDDLEVSVTYIKSSSAMPDTGRNIKIFEMEAVLDYDVVAPSITDVETDEEYDDNDTGVTITGATFEASQGSGTVEMGDDSDYATANKVEQTVTSWAATSIDFTADLGAQSPGSKWLFVTNNSAQKNDPGFPVTVHREQAFKMAASGNITASGENTTVQLAAPTGKTTADFDAGRIQDDENPADTVDLTEDDYTELEWCISAKDAANLVQYAFRVTKNGSAITNYTVTPKLTIIVATFSLPPRQSWINRSPHLRM